MKKRIVATAIITLVVPSLMRADEVQFRLARRHFVIVPVRVNGQGPYDFLFDTGSTTTLVDRSLFEELGLAPLGETAVRSASGTERVPIARVDSMTLGSETTRTVLVLASRLDGIRKLDGDIRGVLGFNFISRFRYLLDYTKSRLVFDDDLTFEGARVPFDAAHRSITVTSGGVRWLLDTGATGVVLFGDVDLDVELSSRSVRRIATNDGTRIARSGRIRCLEIEDASFDRLPVTFARQTGLEDRADGLLPGTLFASIYVDHEQNVVVFNPSVSRHASLSRSALAPMGSRVSTRSVHEP